MSYELIEPTLCEISYASDVATRLQTIQWTGMEWSGLSGDIRVLRVVFTTVRPEETPIELRFNDDDNEIEYSYALEESAYKP